MDRRTFYGNRKQENVSQEAESESDSDDSRSHSESELSFLSESSEDEDTSDDSSSSTEDDPVSSSNENDPISYVSNNIQQDSSSWKTVTSSQRTFPSLPCQEQFFGDVNCSSNPLDVYKLFITDDIMEMMFSETNRYASQTLARTTITRRSRLKKWVPCTKEELWKFLAIRIYMGLVPLPEVSLYWSKSKIYNNPLVSENMGRDRFQLLSKMMHFANNDIATTSRNYKIQPLIDKLLEKYQSIYIPSDNLVIDESIVHFRGRVIFRQYIPGKSHKYGCKLYKLCCTSGYTLNLEVYVGKSEIVQGFSCTESVVIRLMKNYLEKGFTLFCDNYYTSVNLGNYLLTKQTYICGTIRPNRKGLPKDVVKAKLKRGECKGLQNVNEIKVFNWKDKRNVFTLSTVPGHTSELIETSNLSKNRTPVKKPASVLDYNNAKKGVDLSDQMGSYYSSLKKCRKWYHKVAIELLTGTSIVNSWVIYNKFCQRKYTSMRKFKESILLSLLTGSPDENLKSGKRKIRPNENAKTSVHHLIEASGPKRKTRKRCRGCYDLISSNEGSKMAAKKSKKVSTFCDSCDGSPYFCLSCFRMHHSE